MYYYDFDYEPDPVLTFVQPWFGYDPSTTNLLPRYHDFDYESDSELSATIVFSMIYVLSMYYRGTIKYYRGFN